MVVPLPSWPEWKTVSLAARRLKAPCLGERPFVEKLALRRGWTVTAVYTDNDISASNGKPRPAYRRMLGDLREGLAGAVIVWDLDRLHRRPKELEEFIELADYVTVNISSPNTASQCTRPLAYWSNTVSLIVR